MSNTNNKKKTQRITEVEYKGPKKTFTDLLTKSQIIDLLDSYQETPFHKLKKGHLIRYFSINKDTKKLEFKMGGIISHVTINLDTDPIQKYVVLSNGKVTWSAQADSIFFQQIPISQIKQNIEDQYKELILKQNDEIQLNNKLIKKLYDQISELEKTIKKIKNK